MDQLLGDDGAPGHSAANAAGRSLGTGDHDKRPFKTTEVVRRRADLTVYRFHHTSLVDGGKVIGAGEWIVRKGKLWNQWQPVRSAALVSDSARPTARLNHVPKLRTASTQPSPLTANRSRIGAR